MTHPPATPAAAAVAVGLLAASLVVAALAGWWPDAPVPGADVASPPGAPAAVAHASEPAPRLHRGTPREAALRPEPLDQLAVSLRAATHAAQPAFPGAVALVARHATVALHEATGRAVRFADGDATELPDDAQRAMAPDTIVDLASLSKLFTTVAVLQLVEDGAVGLDQPVATVLPRFGESGKGEVTVRQLLTHTGGLPAGARLWTQNATRDERRDAVLATELATAPGTTRRYSDLGFIVLGELVAELTGSGLDEVVRERITEPLGMTDTSYTPEPADAERIAATEHQPWLGRGLVHGEVADPNAYALGGVAGHAGVFSTARDLAVLGQTLLNGGRYGHTRILESDTVDDMLADQLGGADGDGQGLGVWRAPCQLTDQLTTADTVGHTGYTGTALMIEPATETVVVLLTNRTHASASGPSVAPHRREVANAVAAALGDAQADRVACPR